MAHKTKSGKQSQAWKDLENKVAALFKSAGFRRAKRVIKETHDSAPDVDLPEVPDVAIDTKYSMRGFPQHTQFMAEVETYVGARRRNEERTYDWAIMPIRPGGSSDILVVLRLERLIDLMKKVYLRNDAGSWGCMRCGNPITESGLFAGHYQYKCSNCGLCCSSDETPDPKNQERVLSQRDKLKASAKKLDKATIKDKSSEEVYKPLPGQLSAQDLIQRKKNVMSTKKTRKAKEKTCDS